MNEADIPEVPDVDIVERVMGHRCGSWSIGSLKPQSNILTL